MGTAWLTIKELNLFNNFLGWDLGVVFSPGRYQQNQSEMICKFSKVNWQIPGWPKSKITESLLSIKSFVNILIVIEESLKIENGTQYTNYQRNNSIKNQIYQKINHNTSLWIDFMMRQSQCHQESCCCYHTTWETNRYAKEFTSPDVQYHCTLLVIRIMNLSYNGILKASNKTHWKLGVEI